MPGPLRRLSGSFPERPQAMTDAPRISVVIATYNRRATLARTLATVFSQDLPAHEYEVVVVVDGSTDGTVEMLRGLRPACTLRLVTQANRGQAAARNAGAKAALGEQILFLDDDMLCSPLLLRHHIAARGDSDSVVVFGPVPVAPESPATLTTDLVREYTDSLLDRLARQDAPRFPDDTMVCSNTSLARSTLMAAGGFDERFFRWFEDIELGQRLLQTGVRFLYQPSAVAYHLHVKSARALVENQVWNGRSQVLLCRTHPIFRRYTPLGPLARGDLWQRLARQAAIRSPASPEPMLAPLFAIAEELRGIPWARHAAVRVLQMRSHIQFLRGAVREAGSCETLEREFGVRLPVLLFHHVGRRPLAGHPDLTVAPARFEDLIRWLSHRGYTTIRPSDWLRWCSEGLALPPKPVLITFDDAYAEIAEHALPILQRYGFGATIFVITGGLGRADAACERATRHGHPLLSREQIRHWSGLGFDFGAHGRTHADLTSLDNKGLDSEVAGSRCDLEETLGTPVHFFSYPYGSHDERVRERVRSTFDLAFGTEEGLNDLHTTQDQLRRLSVRNGTTVLDLSFRVRGHCNPLAWLRARARLRSRLRHVASAIQRFLHLFQQ